MTTAIKEVIESGFRISNESAGIYISLEEALQILPVHWRPTTPIRIKKRCGLYFYEWETNGCELSLSGDLTRLYGEGNNLFIVLEITEYGDSYKLCYNIVNKECIKL
jgi:hypothetical protein